MGEFETTYAVFGGLVGCPVECAMLPPNIFRIALAADPDLLENVPTNGVVEETLVIDLDNFDPTEAQPVGVPLSASLRATRGGASLQTYMAQVVLDQLPTVEQVSEPFDPRTAAVVTGSVTAESPGWSVAGTFAASYCPESNVIFSCE